MLISASCECRFGACHEYEFAAEGISKKSSAASSTRILTWCCFTEDNTQNTRFEDLRKRCAPCMGTKPREPSLSASSARSGTKLEDVLREWMSTPMAWLGVTADAERNLQNAAFSYVFSLFALALAQHYGLPSVGLDVTQISTDAVFCPHETGPGGGRSQAVTCRRKNPADGDSVLYILAPNEAYELNYDDFRPPGFRALRPERQAARFMHEGWGLRENAAAHHLFMALYLNPAATSIRSACYRPFPSRIAGPLFRTSPELCALQGLPARFQQFLQRYYFVE